jgi:hypothetical protein
MVSSLSVGELDNNAVPLYRCHLSVSDTAVQRPAERRPLADLHERFATKHSKPRLAEPFSGWPPGSRRHPCRSSRRWTRVLPRPVS